MAHTIRGRRTGRAWPPARPLPHPPRTTRPPTRRLPHRTRRRHGRRLGASSQRSHPGGFGKIRAPGGSPHTTGPTTLQLSGLTPDPLMATRGQAGRTGTAAATWSLAAEAGRIAAMPRHPHRRRHTRRRRLSPPNPARFRTARPSGPAADFSRSPRCTPSPHPISPQGGSW